MIVPQTNLYSLVPFRPQKPPPPDSLPQPCHISAIVSKLTHPDDKRQCQVLLGWVAPMPKITPSASLSTHHLGVFESMEIGVVIHGGKEETFRNQGRRGQRKGSALPKGWMSSAVPPAPVGLGAADSTQSRSLLSPLLAGSPPWKLSSFAQLQRKKQ